MKYVISSPPYRNSSAGYRVLYELQKHLVRCGEDAIVVNFPCTIEDDDIVIYPEIVKGNPLHARRVVRYILMIPGYFGERDGGTVFPSSELLVAYNPQLAKYSTNNTVLTIDVTEPFFTNTNPTGSRPTNCVWIGKGLYKGESIDTVPPELESPNCKLITHGWPTRRREVATLLNQTHTLYTLDDFTALADEARYCGCEVRLVEKGSIVPYPHPLPNYDNFNYQMDRFITLSKQL